MSMKRLLDNIKVELDKAKGNYVVFPLLHELGRINMLTEEGLEKLSYEGMLGISIIDDLMQQITKQAEQLKEAEEVISILVKYNDSWLTDDVKKKAYLDFYENGFVEPEMAIDANARKYLAKYE